MLYPILNESRALIDLSGIWQFQLDDGTGFEEEWMKRSLPHPELLAVPASYNDQKEKTEYRDHYGWAFVRDIVAPAMDVVCFNRYYGWYVYGGDLKISKEAFDYEMK